MHRCLLPLAATAGLLALSSCGSSSLSGTHPTGTGPFDERGNYVEEWADSPSKWNGRSVKPPKSEPQPTAVAKNDPPPAVKPTARTSSSTTTVTATKPKPVSKPKPKPKPTSKTHTVRKGDTLYGLAKRYGTTVSKIQKANGISGSTIRIGQRLRIPL